jgi:hypothetical protein
MTTTVVEAVELFGVDRVRPKATGTIKICPTAPIPINPAVLKLNDIWKSSISKSAKI